MRYATNKFSAPCIDCGESVPAGAGRLWKAGRAWKVSHGGTCGRRAARDDGRSMLFVTSSGAELFQNVHGRCEDAPCCGCCNF